MADNTKPLQIVAVTTIFFVLAWIFVGLRCYVRIVVLQAFGADDALAISSLIFFSLTVGLCWGGISTGLGQHVALLSNEDFEHATMCWYIAEILYIPTTAMIKMSIALYLNRIAVKPVHILTIALSMGTFLIFSIIFFVLSLLQCQPTDYFWRQIIPGTEGKCWDGRVLGVAAYAHSAISILVDLALGIVPAFIVADLQMSQRTKVAIALTLALGSVGSISTIVRIPFLTNLISSSDYLYNIANVIIVTAMEMAMGIITCCLATLKPLLQTFFNKSDGSLGSQGNLHSRDGGHSRLGGGPNDTELYLRPDLRIVGFTTTITSNGRSSTYTPPDKSSLNRSIDVKTETWYAPADDTSGKAIMMVEPVYHIR